MRHDVLGVGIDAVTEAQALDIITGFVREGGAHQVVTANPEILDNATRTPALHALIRRAALVTADGQGVLLAGRILGTPFPARVTGIELAEALCRESAARGLSLYFLGAAPGVVDEAAEKCVPLILASGSSARITAISKRKGQQRCSLISKRRSRIFSSSAWARRIRSSSSMNTWQNVASASASALAAVSTCSPVVWNARREIFIRLKRNGSIASPATASAGNAHWRCRAFVLKVLRQRFVKR